MDLPTYTNIWRIEKRLYKLYDFRLPAPLPITWIGVFTGITVPYVIFLIAVGLPFNHNLVWLYILPPGVLTWLTTRPVIESKRLPELVGSQLRYLSEPRTWCRMAPCSEKDEISVSVRVWHRSPPRERPKTSRTGKVRSGRAGRHVITARHPAGPLRPASPAAALPVLTGDVTAVQVSPLVSTVAASVAAEEITSQQPASAEVPVQVRATAGPEVKRPRSGRSAPRPDRPGPRPGRSWPNRRREPEPEPEPNPAPAADDDPGPVAEQRPVWGVSAPDGVADPRVLEVSHDFVPDPNGHDGFGIPFALTSWPALEPGGWPKNGLRTADPVGDAAEADQAAGHGRARGTAGPESQRDPDNSAKPSPPIPAWPQAPVISGQAHAQLAPWTQEPAPVAEPLEPEPVADSSEPEPEPEPAAAAEPVEPAAAAEPVEPAAVADPVEPAVSAPADPPVALAPVPPVPADPSGDVTPAPAGPGSDPPAAAASAPMPTAPAEPASAVAAPIPPHAPAEPAAAAATAPMPLASAATTTPVPSVLAAPAAADPPAAAAVAPVASAPVPPAPVNPPAAAAVAPVASAPVPPAPADSPAAAAVAPVTPAPAAPAAAPPLPVVRPPRSASPAASPVPPAASPARFTPRVPPAPHVPAANPVPPAPWVPPATPVPPPSPRVAARVVGSERPLPSIERALSGHDGSGDNGWRRRVKVVTGPGRRDQDSNDRDRVRLPLPGPRLITILGCTGGAGQTVTALLTGHILAALREIPVAAVDLNPGRDSLAERIPPAFSVTALLAGETPEDSDGNHADNRTGPTSTRFGRSGSRSRLEVIGGGPDVARTLGEEHYRRLAGVLAEGYPLAIIDPAPSGLTRVLSVTDQLVLVAPASPDAATSLANTLAWLGAHSYGELAAHSVTLINGVSRRTLEDALRAESVARGRCRAIVRVPWDDQLPAWTGSPATLLPQTRLAYTALAGVLVAGLAAQETTQETAQGTTQGTTQGPARGPARGAAQSAAGGAARGAAQGSAEGRSPGEHTD